MPVRPEFEWEQTAEDVFLHITIKGFKPEAIDVFLSDLFTKVNAPPTYLLSLDLLHAVDPDNSTHFHDAADPSLLHVRLRKAAVGVVWDALCLQAGTATAVSKRDLLERRAGSMRRAEERYNQKLAARGQQRETERRRMTEEQWGVEREQRAVIESRFAAEKRAAEEELYEWEQQVGGGGEGERVEASVPRSPADIIAAAAVTLETTSTTTTTTTTPISIRGTDTVNVSIDFTPKMFAMPTRSRGDEEHYRQSRYKPVSVEDSPMFWKDRGDGLYRSGDWRGAANAYSESVKRDGVFLTCVMNRAACYLKLGEFKKAAEDCTLSLTMLANTPASEVTQERYRALMTKLHARRAAAHSWGEELLRGRQDLRMAAAYRDPTSDDDILSDLAAVEKAIAERGLDKSGEGEEGGEEEERRLAAKMMESSALYYKNDHEAAAGVYRSILAVDPHHAQARSNLAASLLQLGQFKPALAECEAIMDFCRDVAGALNQPGGLASNEIDSDDEDDEDDEAEAGDHNGNDNSDAAACTCDDEREGEAEEGGARPSSSSSGGGGGRMRRCGSSNGADMNEVNGIDGTGTGTGNSNSNANRTQGGRLETVEEQAESAAAAASRDEMTRRRRAAARKISESSGHVYLLLKAYVRAAAALCGLKEYHSAHAYLDRALRITPYDNDLVDDCNRLIEKARMETLVAASTGGVMPGAAGNAASPPATAVV